MKQYLHVKNIWIGIFVVIFFGMATSAYYVGKYQEKKSLREVFYNTKQIRLPNDQYPLVSRLIAAEFPKATEIGFYDDLYSQINTYVNNQIKTSPLKTFTFYFRDLNSGMWFGINEDDENIPASLFKLPIALTYYKDAMNDKTLLNRRYTYTKDIDSKVNTKIGLEKSNLVIGDSYTVSELIDMMLTESDNGSKEILQENINTKTLNTLFNLVQLPGPAQNNYFISPKEYSFFFRMLYNGSYLGQEKSQIVLSLLSKTTFNEGIRKAVPDDITVVHKFGSLNLIDKETGAKMIGFRDCGIIYYPQKPFLVCFILSGDDQESLAKDVETVTGYVLNYVQRN